MKKYIFTLIALFFCVLLFSQQEQHNTQFMYFKQGYNPGYAGSREAFCMSAIYRTQWIGLEGAPEQQVLTFSLPIANQRIGLGGNIYRRVAGISQDINLDGVYSYRLRLGRGYLGIGVQTSVRSIQQNFLDTRLTATQSMTADQSIPSTMQQKFVFNFGAGLYYSGETFYVGASAPRLLKNNIDFADEDMFISREVQHLYVMGGLTLPLGDNLLLRPQTLIKYAENAPLDADVNASFIYVNRYIMGLTYRLGGSSNTGAGESIDVIVAMQLTPSVLFGLSYDFTLSDLKDYNTGSIEATIQYCAGKSEGDEYINPRFF